MPITWDAEANHKMLLYLVKRIENKDIDIDNLATLFEGATPKAIRERVAKLRRESKAIEDGAGAETPTLPSPSSDNNNNNASNDNNTNNNDLAGTSIDNNTSPAKTSPAKARGRPKKSAKNGKDDVVNGGPVANGKGGKTGGGPKRKRGGNAKDKAGEGEEGYGGDADVEEDGEGWVKKVKTEGGKGDGKGEGEEKGEGGFMVEEEEVVGEGEGMVEA